MSGINEKKKRNWKNITGYFLFVVLLISIAYTIVRIIMAPSELTVSDAHVKIKSDYVLMLIQCILGLIVMMIPSIVERRLSIDIPNNMEVLYFIFLFCAIYLGEVRDFYYLIPYWDTILHAFSGAMLGALGFWLVSFLNDASYINLKLSPFFVAMFAFCFALAAGAAWEIYEFTFDGLLSLNMQKHTLKNGIPLVGREALEDTMKDIIVDAVSAFAVSTTGYYQLLKQEMCDTKDIDSML
ncbi:MULTISPECIES: hypothetical protein [unclassified Sedimentibacter]|uniref:hypothetical protein n=1 Tax=unclassified Sedimentibacter TaxID=2649220 RepID=UPI0027E00570|nr:hypothetical protein [Sedimentibacter sp. MB35-C1]WMJ75742.1 hypothetical protein RBQ61_08860 [Sedimentibacter sp. MB35-C1]